MSNFIPEMSGHFVFTTLGTKSADIDTAKKIASEISQKSPDEIMEFLMFVYLLGNCYSNLVVKRRSGKNTHDHFISTLKTMPLRELFERSRS